MNMLSVKQFCAIALPVVLLLSCSTKNTSDAPVTASTDKQTDTTTYPYKATYSSNVSSSTHPEYAQKVLTVWRLFEKNQTDSMAKYYADTVTYEDAGGFRFHGPAGALLKMAGQGDAALDSLRFDISMWQNIHVNDKNEDWVYIWAIERKYPKNGKADTSRMHEQWKIVDGKIAYFNEYNAKTPKP
jgi:hypothetical protein